MLVILGTADAGPEPENLRDRDPKRRDRIGDPMSGDGGGLTSFRFPPDGERGNTPEPERGDGAGRDADRLEVRA